MKRNLVVVQVKRDDPLQVTMNAESFLDTVQEGAAIDSEEEAREVTEATLRAIGEGIPDELAADLADPLPRELGKQLTREDVLGRRTLSIGEFEEIVSDWTDLEEEEVLVHARPVVGALEEATDEATFQRFREVETFDHDEELLLERGAYLDEEDFLWSVREKADLDSTEAARDATRAGLQTFGEWLSRDEARQLATYLPPELRHWLIEREKPDAEDLGPAALFDRVDARTDLDADGKVLAQAVVGAISAVASESEFERAREQFPQEFDILFELTDPVETA